MTDLEGRDDMFKHESCWDDRQPPAEPASTPAIKPEPEPPTTSYSVMTDEEPEHWHFESWTLD